MPAREAVVTSRPFVLVVEARAAPGVVIAAGRQGPAGRDGVDGATISPDPNNQIENRPNGLYVAPTEWVDSQW